MSEIDRDNSMIVSAKMKRPKTAKRRLNDYGIVNINYFAFYKYSNLIIIPPPFIEDFMEDNKQ